MIDLTTRPNDLATDHLKSKSITTVTVFHTSIAYACVFGS